MPRTLGHLLRSLSLMFLAALGTSVLVYSAPGYFADARELDAAHSATSHAQLEAMQQSEATLGQLLRAEAQGWLRGDLGVSRQYGVPVSGLLRERVWISAKLLASGVTLGWGIALLAAVPLSLSHRQVIDAAVVTTTTLLLAVPVGALATVCLIWNRGGPVLVLATIIAVRDFKLLHRILRELWKRPFLLHARAHGVSTPSILRFHVLPTLHQDLLSLAAMSFTLALSALVPVEVVFDRAGLGQLAWSAASYRDLPVLVVVTSLIAACVGLAGALAGSAARSEREPCV